MMKLREWNLKVRIAIEKSTINAKHEHRNETSLPITLNLFFAISLVVDRSIRPVVVDAVMNFFGNGLLLSPPQKSCKLTIEVVSIGIK